MIRRSPCELYIKFLLCHPEGYSLEAARAIVVKQQLDWVSDNYAQGLRDRMTVPNPFFPTDPAHKPSLNFVYKEKLKSFFLPDKYALMAHRLVSNARAKETIETMALAKDPPAFIAHRVRTLGLECNTQAIQHYLSCYWDLMLVDTLEINAIIAMRRDYIMAFPSGPSGEPTVFDRMEYNAMNSVKYRDPRAMVLSNPISPVAGMLNRIRDGVIPKNVELGQIANAAVAAAMLRTLESLTFGGPKGGEMSRDYAMSAKLVMEIMHEMGSPEAELQKGLQKLAMQNEDSQLPLLSALSGGSHTTDLMPAHEEIAVGEVEEIEGIEGDKNGPGA